MRASSHTGFLAGTLIVGSERIVESRDLAAGVGEGLAETASVDGIVEPGACAGRVREGNRDGIAEQVALADTIRERPGTDERPGGESTDGDHEGGAEQPQFLGAPGAAESLLGRRRSPVAASGSPSGVAPGHRGAIEDGVERLLVELQPASQRPACPPAPRCAFGSLDDAGRLSVQIGPSACGSLDDGCGLDREAGIATAPAASEIKLQRADRGVPPDRIERRLGGFRGQGSGITVLGSLFREP